MCIRDRSVGRAGAYIGRNAIGIPLSEWNLYKPFHKSVYQSVSFTHLTLPTSDLIKISVVAASLKKKKTQIACAE